MMQSTQRRGRRAIDGPPDWVPWRWPVDMAATVHERGSCALAITVVDLSMTGCRIRAGFRLNTGRPVLIAIDDFAPFRGRVIWAKDWYAAVMFDRPVHPSVLGHLVARYPEQSAAAADGSRD